MSGQRPRKSKFAPRVLSGVQPSGILHLGVYFGATKQHIDLQDEYPGECFYFIADYHAMTTIQDRELLRKYANNVALDYLALGLDPAKATFYRQSDVPQVCELTWIFSCVAGMGLLERAHAYKEKLQQGLRPSVGLFLYPVLMAADILAVRSTTVPVGEDQGQHLEMTRDIAKSFNAAFGNKVFPLPKARYDIPTVVPGIDGRKMSKSYDNAIPIFADDDELRLKVGRIKTSPLPLGSPIDPESDIVFAIYSLVASPEEQADMRTRYEAGSVGYRQAKAELTEKLREYFLPFKARRRELEQDADLVEDILSEGARRASAEITETLELVRESVGLGRYKDLAAL